MIRLPDTAIEQIRKLFLQFFLPGDALWIFGSRVRPEEKGGDIDLYIETTCTNADHVLDMKLRFLAALKSKIGDQKIDVIIKFGNFTLPIYQIAKETGIQLTSIPIIPSS